MTPRTTRLLDQPHDKAQMPSRLARIFERACYREIRLLTFATYLGGHTDFRPPVAWHHPGPTNLID